MRLDRILLFAGLLAAGLAASPAHADSPRSDGGTRHRDMIYVTVLRTATERAIPQSAYYSSTPDRGHVYLTVWLRAVNRNDVQLSLSAGDFTVTSPDGRSHDREYVTPAPDLGSDAVLDVGGQARGTLTFQIPASQHRATLRWAPSAPCCDLHWPRATWTLTF